MFINKTIDIYSLKPQFCLFMYFSSRWKIDSIRSNRSWRIDFI